MTKPIKWEVNLGDLKEPPEYLFRPVVWILVGIAVMYFIVVLIGKYTKHHYPANMPESMEQVAALMRDCERENQRECVLNPVPVAKVGGKE